MAVTAAFLAKVKTALRVSFNNLDSQISDLIEEAILDLTNDDKYFAAYNDMKTKMAVSGAYRSVMPDEE